MLRCILVALPLTASALHSPSLQEVEASEEVELKDDIQKVAVEDNEDNDEQDALETGEVDDNGLHDDEDGDKDDEDENADSLAEVAEDVDVDGDIDDLDDDMIDDDDDDDDDDDLDLDDDLDDDGDDDLDIDLDDDLDSLVEEDGESGEDPGDDEDDEDDDDDADEDADDDEDDDTDDDDDDENAEQKSPTMLAEAAEERGESREFEFVADMPLEKGPTDQAAVFAKAKAAGKPAMVLATKGWCPHCKDLAESMNADPAIKTLMSKFVAFHAPDAQGDAWHGDIGYVPRAFFYNTDGQQIDVHSPYAQYPYFFDSSQVLQAGMQQALSQA